MCVYNGCEGGEKWGILSQAHDLSKKMRRSGGKLACFTMTRKVSEDLVWKVGLGSLERIGQIVSLALCC